MSWYSQEHITGCYWRYWFSKRDTSIEETSLLPNKHSTPFCYLHSSHWMQVCFNFVHPEAAGQSYVPHWTSCSIILQRKTIICSCFSPSKKTFSIQTLREEKTNQHTQKCVRKATGYLSWSILVVNIVDCKVFPVRSKNVLTTESKGKSPCKKNHTEEHVSNSRFNHIWSPAKTQPMYHISASSESKNQRHDQE